MRRVEAANPSLTVGALNLVPEFSATFDMNFMMQVLTVAVPASGRRMHGPANQNRLPIAVCVACRAKRHNSRF